MDRDITAALAATGLDAARRLAAREELNRLGYIWCPPGQLPPVLWGAGIPCLMQYVQDQAAAKPGKRDTSSLSMSRPEAPAAGALRAGNGSEPHGEAQPDAELAAVMKSRY